MFFSLEETVREKLLEKINSDYDSDAFVKSIEKYFINLTLKKGEKGAIQSFTKHFGITLENNEYSENSCYLSELVEGNRI